MAIRTINVSDLSGETLAEDDKTIRWGWDGKLLDLDLTKPERERFEKLLAKYIEASQPVGRLSGHTTEAQRNAPRPGSPAQVTGTPLDTMTGAVRRRELDAIREWADAKGLKVNKRGRMAAQAIKDFYAEKANTPDEG